MESFFTGSLSTAGSGDRLAADAAASARSLGIPYLVVNRDALPPHQLSRDELEAAGFQLVESAGTRELYLARPAVPPQR